MMDPLHKLHPSCLPLLRRHNLLRKLVEQEVIAGVVAEVEVSPEERAAALQGLCGQRSLEDCVEASAQSHGWSAADLEWQALLPLRCQRFSLNRFGDKAEARFLARKPQLDQVVYSLLRVKDGALGQELYFQLADGEATFADLSQRYGEGPERSTNGLVGPKPLVNAHPQLAERLRISAEGQVLEPFRLLDWWLIARVEQHLPASFTPEIAAQMAQELFQNWVSEQTTDRLQALLQAMATAEAHPA